MKNMWQKVLRIFSRNTILPEQKKQTKITDEIMESFISSPETFILYRGESNINKGGIHFTTDITWAKNFGENILTGTLRKNSKIHLWDEKDFQTAINITSYTGKIDELALFKFILEQNDYDAILATDFMNSEALDIMVNPKHLKIFKLLV